MIYFPGFFCAIGAFSPTPCPYGVFGSSIGVVNSSCSGPCATGFVDTFFLLFYLNVHVVKYFHTCFCVSCSYMCLPGSTSSTPALCPSYLSCSQRFAVCGSVADDCNNRTVLCGPALCGIPSVSSWAVSINMANPSQPVTLSLVFNQSISVNSTAVVASWVFCSRRIEFTIDSSVVDYGCALIRVSGMTNTTVLVNAPAAVAFHPADIPTYSNLASCSTASSAKLKAIIVNSSSLSLTVPSPLFSANCTSTFTLLVNSIASAVQPVFSLNTPILFSVAIPAGTFLLNLVKLIVCFNFSSYPVLFKRTVPTRSHFRFTYTFGHQCTRSLRTNADPFEYLSDQLNSLSQCSTKRVQYHNFVGISPPSWCDVAHVRPSSRRTWHVAKCCKCNSCRCIVLEWVCGFGLWRSLGPSR